MTLTRNQTNEAYRQLEGDLQTLFKLVFSYRKPITESDLRSASVILRKWLTDGLLGKMCSFAENKPTFFALDNAEILELIKDVPSIEYYLTGGVKFNGTPVIGTFYSTLPMPEKPLLPLHEIPEKEFSFGEFLNQRRIFFRGNYFTTAEIIKFTANKLGGAHFDHNRTGKNALLEEAAYFMMFGGPIDPDEVDLPCQIYLALEREGAEILSGMHIEIIAAATSFINIRLDGRPIIQLTRNLSLRTRIRNLLGLNKARYRMFDLDEKYRK